MRFPRQAKVFHGQLDAAPVAGVFFLLLIFLLLSVLIYTPGSVIQLPVARSGVGVEGPTVVVSVDANGRYYFENQVITPDRLRGKMSALSALSHQPLTLIVLPDRRVPYAVIQTLVELASEAGIKHGLLGTRIIPDRDGP